MRHALGVLTCLTMACSANPTSPPTTTSGSNGGAGSAMVAKPASTFAIDLRYGEDGHTTFSIGDREHQLHDVIALPDGSALAVGHASFPDLDMAVARFRPDGTLDRTFGDRGNGVARVGATGAFGRSLGIDDQGRILAVGYYHAGGGKQEDLVLGRLLPDGKPDLAFGTNGSISLDLTNSDDRPAEVFAMPDGTIVVVGIHSKPGGDYESYLARFDGGGSLDTTFGRQGIAYFDPVQGKEFTTRAVRDPNDGAIFLVGYTVGGDRPSGFIARLSANGAPDPRFGRGSVTMIDSVAVSTIWAAAREPNMHKIVIGGQLTSNRSFIARVHHRDGSLDPSWGKAGIALGPRTDDQFYDLLPHPDGSLIGVGFRNSGDAARPMLARYKLNGRLDAGFGKRGILLGPHDGDFLFGGVIDPRGGIIAVGMTLPDDQIRGLVMRFAPTR